MYTSDALREFSHNGFLVITARETCKVLDISTITTSGAVFICIDVKCQGSGIRSVRIIFSEKYVRTLTYSIVAYVNKNRICMQTVIADTADWFFATFVINLLPNSVVQNGQIK